MSKKLPNISSKKLYHFVLLPTWVRVPCQPYSPLSFSHPNKYETASHSVFIFISLMTDFEYIFICILIIYIIFFCKASVHIFCPLWGCPHEFVRASLYCVKFKSFVRYMHCEYFSQTVVAFLFY